MNQSATASSGCPVRHASPSASEKKECPVASIKEEVGRWLKIHFKSKHLYLILCVLQMPDSCSGSEDTLDPRNMVSHGQDVLQMTPSAL